MITVNIDNVLGERIRARVPLKRGLGFEKCSKMPQVCSKKGQLEVTEINQVFSFLYKV